MDKEFYDKYSDGLKCYGCDYLLQCKKSNSPILAKCIPNMNYVDKIIGLKDKITDLEAKLEDSEKVIEAYEMKEKYLKKYYNFTDEQCKMHDLLTQLWHLTYLPNKHFAEVLRSILKEVENV